jgi:hypothetical protein
MNDSACDKAGYRPGQQPLPVTGKYRQCRYTGNMVSL